MNRQEVAERLRNVQVYDSFEDGACLCDQFDVINALGLVPDEDTSWITADSVDALADLIDSTCKRIKKISDTGYWWECSKCGGWFVDGFSEEYCPKCGARIVEEK